MSWREGLHKLIDFLNKYDSRRTFQFRGYLQRKFTELEESVMDQLVYEAVGSLILEANKWVKHFKRILNRTKGFDEVREVLMTRELKSFLSDPKRHLKKKIMFYLHDMLREVIDIGSFEDKALAAIKTSLRTNMRTIYQDWILLAIINIILSGGGKVVYPESKVISLERSGAQKLGWIPPNIILRVPGKGYISIFIEVPRPIGWGDTKDLRRIWKLYTTLRPDIMVYSGMIMNILDLSSDPPIKRPDLIIEVKELSDWYDRVREVRGPFAKPLTVERWRSMWIEGLWDGLAGILGVKRRDERGDAEERRVKRLKDVEIVKLYKALYKPKYMMVITRKRTPSRIKRLLESDGIIIMDKIGFKENKLISAAEILKRIAAGEDELQVRLSGNICREVKKLSFEYGVSEEKIVDILLNIGLRHKGEVDNFLN